MQVVYFASKASRLPPRPSNATPVSLSFPHPRLPVCARPSHMIPSPLSTFASARRRRVQGFAIGRRRHSGEQGGFRGRSGDGGTNARGGKTRVVAALGEEGEGGRSGMLCSEEKLRFRAGLGGERGAKRWTSVASARYPTGLRGLAEGVKAALELEEIALQT